MRKYVGEVEAAAQAASSLRMEPGLGQRAKLKESWLVERRHTAAAGCGDRDLSE